MANVNVTIRMDKELKKEAEELFDELGLNLSSAINIFIRQAVREQRIPFSITKRKTSNMQIANSMKMPLKKTWRKTTMSMKYYLINNPYIL